MLKLNRVVIPIGLKCNFNCRYCLRDISKTPLPEVISEDMKQYLQTITSDWCESVIITGGEPLLYFERVKEIFSYIPKTTHKCIISNCSMITQEIVNYINENDIEVHLSHDGAETEYLRGVDVLKNPKLRDLIRQIKILMVFAVVTNINTNIRANYEDTVKKLGRRDIIYKTNAVYQTPTNKDLIDGFDYDEFARTFEDFLWNISEYTPYYCNCRLKDSKERVLGVNIDLQGNVIGMTTSHKFGTIYNSKEEIIKAQDEWLIKEAKYCNSVNCIYRNRCVIQRELASEHFCKCNMITGECYGQFD